MNNSIKNADNRIKLSELISVLIVSLVIVLGITCALGTLTSGWHFVDDHEFFSFEYFRKYQHFSFGDLLNKYLEMDMRSRSTYLYFPFRILLYYLVGVNSYILSIEKAIETALAMTLLYWCGRKISGSVFSGVMFSLISLVGYQSAIWWKLGPPHVQGLICFGVSFVFLLYWLEDTSNIAYAVISFFFALFMGLFHESFMLLIPFLALYIFYDTYQNNSIIKSDVEKKRRVLWEVIKSLSKERIILLIAFMAAFLTGIMSIVIRLGLNSYDAVGIDDSTSLITYLKVITNNVNYDLKWYWKFGIVLTGILLTFYEKLKEYWMELIIALSIVIPQLILYGKEGIAERYVVPFSIGFALFFCVFMWKAPFLAGKRKMLYALVLIALLGIHSHVLIVEGDYYRFRGQSVTNALEQIDELSDKGYNVMSCFGNSNPEAEFTIDAFLKSKGKPDIYYWDQDNKKVITRPPFMADPETQDFDWNKIDVILAYNRNDRHFEVDPNIDLSDFILIRSGSVDLYFRNDAKKEVNEALSERLYVKPTIYGIGM